MNQELNLKGNVSLHSTCTQKWPIVKENAIFKMKPRIYVLFVFKG